MNGNIKYLKAKLNSAPWYTTELNAFFAEFEI